MEKIHVAEIVKILKLNIENEKEADLKKEITVSGVHRAGLELAGVYESSHTDKQIIGWGTKESHWLTSLGPVEAEKAICRVIAETTPLIILSKGVQPEIKNLILKIANKFGVGLSCISFHLSQATSSINWYLAKRLAPSTTVHGSLVVVYGIGVMLIGPSGIGKSEAVLELIQDGHIFVSDDAVEITQIGNDFNAKSASITRGYLEARGIGLIDIQHMYGAQLIKEENLLELVIELVPGKQMVEFDRLGNMNLQYPILEGEIPKIQIPVEQGRNIAALIKAATSTFISKQDGIDPLSVINQRIRDGV